MSIRFIAVSALSVFGDHWTDFFQLSKDQLLPIDLSVDDHDQFYKNASFWQNSRYFVIRRDCGKDEDSGMRMYWLSIRENDRGTRHDWRDFQRIKNELCGAECEGIEFYPPESRLVDTVNQYHLWVFDKPMFTDVFGFKIRNVSGDSHGQRPFWEEEEKTDYEG